jgi:hypothetical protein
MLPPSLVLGAWFVGLSIVLWRGSDERGIGSTLGGGRQVVAPASQATDQWSSIPIGLEDARLKPLRLAAEAWRNSTGPRRRVVDQVCLVPDVPSFLEALSFWDDRHFFPILIESPTWALPFLRAFRPARVFRFASSESRHAVSALSQGQSGEMASNAVWQRAIRAVSRAWSPPPGPVIRVAGETKSGGRKPARGAPGLVLTTAKSPMFAGAVALAAGRFQGILRFEPPAPARTRNDDSSRGARLDDILSLDDAWRFATRIEARVAAAVPKYNQLGDDCDFLTLAGEWPYRYQVEHATGSTRGIYALDDLVGRRLDPDGDGWLNRTRHRWAYAGRLLGDPAASVARAMAALFLQPSSALFWNTYHGGIPWSDYDLGQAATLLRRNALGTRAVEHRSGRQANLTNWHRIFDPVNRFGLVFVNSSGEPRRFAIDGGPGRPADLPRGLPVAVSMIHSHSAADLSDPQTIAGRWLADGAFIFYGSVNEPFLSAFRRPALVAELLDAGLPFVAALRQGEAEAFGHPWRLIFLGDPLYCLEGSRMSMDSGEAYEPRKRASADEWRQIAPEYANWRVAEMTRPMIPPTNGSDGANADIAATRLAWCVQAALVESAVGSEPEERMTPPSVMARSVGEARARRPIDWRSALRSIERQQLDRKLRSTFDELLIDAIGELGADEELQSRLVQIPSEEKSPRVWQAIETFATARLARLDRESDRARSFRRALDLWSEVIHLPWPRSSSFPGQFTERITAVAAADRSHRMQPWLSRLRAAAQELGAHPGDFGHASVVAAERQRVEAKLNDYGLRY